MTELQKQQIIDAIDKAADRVISLIIAITIGIAITWIVFGCTTQQPTKGHRVEYYYDRPVPVEEIDLTKGDIR